MPMAAPDLIAPRCGQLSSIRYGLFMALAVGAAGGWFWAWLSSPPAKMAALASPMAARYRFNTEDLTDGFAKPTRISRVVQCRVFGDGPFASSGSVSQRADRRNSSLV